MINNDHLVVINCVRYNTHDKQKKVLVFAKTLKNHIKYN